jgi:putative exosortase-associated protein (TIGR04073 family)
MAFKFTRGITNVVTSPVEFPKQFGLTVRDQGGVGFVIGPLKGAAMLGYRAFIGALETVLFLVPQPGYYDPMMEPDFVWNGWEDKRADHRQDAMEPRQTQPGNANEEAPRITLPPG